MESPRLNPFVMLTLVVLFGLAFFGALVWAMFG